MIAIILNNRGKEMNEQTYVSIITDLANQLANKTVNEAEFRARLTQSQQLVAQLAQEVESYRSVLESDKDLKDLFEEVKNKNEVNA
jgi:hypothetical protein